LTFPLEDCSVFGNFVITLIVYFPRLRLGKYKTQTGYMSPYYLSKAYITNIVRVPTNVSYRKITTIFIT